MDLLIPVLFFIVGSLIFIGITLSIWRLLRPHRPYRNKLTAYECGEEPIGSAHGLFNSRFYIMALVFLLFEAELLFLFPWAVAVFRSRSTISSAWATLVSIEIFLFVLILTIGLGYVWHKGYFNWGKNYLPPPVQNSFVPRSVYEAFNNKRQ
jgi:NADH-quinone oxidoreductase subunit A